MMVASKDYADAHPEALRTLVAGTRKAVDFIRADTAAAGAALSKATGMNAKMEQDTLAKLDWQVRLDEEIVASLEQTAAFLSSIGRLKKIPDIRSAARTEFVK